MYSTFIIKFCSRCRTVDSCRLALQGSDPGGGMTRGPWLVGRGRAPGEPHGNYSYPDHTETTLSNAEDEVSPVWVLMMSIECNWRFPAMAMAMALQ